MDVSAVAAGGDLPLPREWDFVVDNNLIRLETTDPSGLDRPPDADDGDRPRIACMEAEALQARLPELVDAVEYLLDPATSFADAQRRHRANVAAANVRRELIPQDSTF